LFKKNHILFIAIACGIAMIGLIFIQFYWINEAIEQGKDELEDKIVASSDKILSDVYKYQAQVAVSKNNKQDLLNKMNQNINQAITFDPRTNTISLNNSHVNASARFKMMDQLMEELMTFGKPMQLEERMPQGVLDSIISSALLSKGIESEFLFGVFGPDGQMAYGNTTRITSLKTSKYVMDLFPADLYSVYKLSLVIPNETRLVIHSMWWMLSVSALLVLIIIFAFYFTISTIVKQKKVSIIKNDFINNMTHELKTPISTISLACEALSDKDLSALESSRTRFVNMISDENKRLGTLVENVLQSAVIDRGDLKLKLSKFNLHQTITKAVANINIQVQQKQGIIETDLLATNDLVEADKVHLSNVVYNLLDNAIKYTQDQPKIRISTKSLVGAIELSIQDNGIGISKEHQAKVFEKLYRIPTGDRHDVKGFGLGLSYVKSIVEHHQGTIKLDSAIGKGSTFIITLPTIKNQNSYEQID